jgi:hypothetical protein
MQTDIEVITTQTIASKASQRHEYRTEWVEWSRRLLGLEDFPYMTFEGPGESPEPSE